MVSHCCKKIIVSSQNENYFHKQLVPFLMQAYPKTQPWWFLGCRKTNIRQVFFSQKYPTQLVNPNKNAKLHPTVNKTLL
jgi:hypothetical protein